MFEIFGMPSTALFGQLLIGLINGSFYALLSLGLAVIFGMLNIIDFDHGAQYMLGAFTAYLILNYSGFGYWPGIDHCADLRGHDRHPRRAGIFAMAVQARSPLRAVAHVRAGADL